MITRRLSKHHLHSLCLWPALIGMLFTLATGCLSDNAQDKPIKPDLHVVEIPLGSDIEIRPVIAQDKIGGHECFSDMMKRLKPYAAINGTFYSKQWIPIGDIVIDGTAAIKGQYTNAFAVRKDGKAEIIRRNGAKFDWSNYKYALAAGPRLVDNGQIMLDLTRDGFRQLSMTVSASRSGIGLTADGHLLLVVCKDPVKLTEFAKLMLDLGATEALNLDGGPACGLYNNGKVEVDAGLQMTNVLVINKR